MNPVARLRSSSRTPFLQVVKTAVAVVAAVLLCRVLIDGPFPTFAAIAALLVVQPSINQSFVKGIERSAGVVLGVVLATGFHLLLGDSVWVVLLVIVLAILIAWALRLTPTSATQVGISGMLVLTAGVVTPNYSADRILETVLGAIVALIVNALIVPPVLLGPAHLAVARLARDTAVAFERIAIGLTEGWDQERWHEALLQARALRQQHARAEAALTAARESLTMNPRRGPHAQVLDEDIAIAEHLRVLVTRVTGMTRAIRDTATPDLRADPVVGSIATEVARIGADVRALGARSASELPDPAGAAASSAVADDIAFPPSQEPPSQEPALTAPIEVVRPNSRHWVLIGALLEDIRRVREELLGEDD
ncbi:aromatic acid exporter family protein [Curtobacterium sp. MCPF17_002]|uniref:FUSC family protein n=1 Tax=Curtobacterium sp. MCPF17_002 TaxID=2175645 RepID=UPI0011B71B95|nr:aromatic acid exporter family protein [Curtobacterium sp. MCPF17_002]WIB78609.1 aromatic acid exporter family protein [Curtobacterium sp. MCPF17_002]